jgi:hypothetical protein
MLGRDIDRVDRAQRSIAMSHTYDYRSSFETSMKVNWRIEDVINGRTFDFSKPFLPETLAGTSGIRWLNGNEKLKLNQLRGFSYLYLFGLVEEYILPSVIEHAGTVTHGDDYEMRALLRFAEEEAKHIQLFKWFVGEFHAKFGSPCRGIGPAKEIAAAILNHSKLGVFLTTLHIEWLTQKHYVESVQNNAAENLDPLFSSLLKHHWLEESQHAKLDTLVVDKVASTLDPKKLEAGIDDYMAIGKMLDGGFAAQVELDLESLEKATSRVLNPEERKDVTAAQIRSYRETFLLGGMRHPNFDRTLRQLSERGHHRVGELARAIS